MNWLRAVRSLLVECKVSDRVGSCKENVRRSNRYLIELRAVRSLLEGKVFDRVGSCKENVREM